MRGLLVLAGALALLGGQAVADDANTGEIAKSSELSLARLAELEQQGGGDGESGDPVLAGYDRKLGFFLRDQDDNFRLQLGGGAQIRYIYKARARRGSSNASTRDQSYFDLERVRLSVKGHLLDPRLQYYFQWDSDTDGAGDMEIIDAYAQYALFDELLQIGVGQHKAYFLRQERASSSKLQLVDRSLANEYFNIDRTLGAWLQGELGEGLIFWNFGVSNGFNSGNRSAGSIDQVPSFSAKIDLNLLGDYGYSEGDLKRLEDPAMVIGVSGATDYNNGTGGNSAAVPEYEVYQFGIDAGFKWMGFSLQGEYMGRWLNYDANPAALDPSVATGEDVYNHGFYVQGGFMVTDDVELVGRVSVVYGNEGINDGTATEFGPGINWYFNGHKIKLSTDLMFFDIPGNMPSFSTNLERHGAGIARTSRSSSATGYDENEQGVLLRTQLQVKF